ncbi:MAG: hypothetical protein FWE57_05985 [Chitinispirillia bacterium]|nr:hypothetical protein [Chitinispirillia bacterium]
MVRLKQVVSKKVRFFLLSALIFALSASAQTKDVLFLGVFNKKGESVEAPLEQALRHELSAGENFRLISTTETQRYLRELELAGVTPLERTVPPKVRTADSTIAIWAVVNESSMRPGRQTFFWGKVDAKLALDLFINDLNSGNIIYRGSIQAEANKRKPFIFINSAQKTVHVSAKDRLELSGQLHEMIVASANGTFDIVLNSLSAKIDETKEETADSTNISDDEHRILSITDTFSEPAVLDLEGGAEQPANEEQTESAADQQNDGMEATITVE